MRQIKDGRMAYRHYLLCILLCFSFTGAMAQLDDLMLVEYVDWDSGDGMAVKIHNPTDADVDLAPYYFRIYNNGNLTPNSEYDLTGIVPAGGYFTLGNSGYCSSCPSSCDDAGSFSGVNDEDVVRLETAFDVVDAIGALGYTGDYQINGNVVTSSLKWVKLVREDFNCTRYTSSDGQSQNSWPTSSADNFTGWQVLPVSCLDTQDSYDYTPVITQLDTAICAPDSIFLQGAWQSTSGTYHDTLATVYQCDSIIETNLMVNTGSVSNASESICPGDSVMVNGEWVYQPGTYVDTTGFTGTCPDLLITEVTEGQEVTNNQAASICQGDSIFLSGDWRFSPGTYTETFTASNGCDSLLVTELQVTDSYLIDQQQTICEGDSLLISGEWQSEAGTYFDSLTTVAGCDSVLAVELVINSFSQTQENTTICMGDSLFVGGEWQTSPGTYLDTNQTGACGEIVITELSFADGPVEEEENLTGCNELTYNGNTYLQSTTIEDTLQSVFGCDSVYQTVNIEIQELSLEIEPVDPVCPGTQIGLEASGSGTITWENTDQGNTTTISPTQSDYFSATVSDGSCSYSDSVFVEVQPAPVLNGPMSYSICQGEMLIPALSAENFTGVQWTPTDDLNNGESLNPEINLAADEQFSVEVFNSCDTIESPVNVSVQPAPYLTGIPDSLSICEGESTTLEISTGDNSTLDWSPETGISSVSGNLLVGPLNSTTFSVSTSNSCGSVEEVLVVQVENLPTVDGPDQVDICAGDSVEYNATSQDGVDYSWSPATGVSRPNQLSTTLAPSQSLNYTLSAENSCGASTFDIAVNVTAVDLTVQGDTLICQGESALLGASGAEEYSWSPSSVVDQPDASSTLAFPTETTEFMVSGQKNGCHDQATILVNVEEDPFRWRNLSLEVLPGETIHIQELFPDMQVISPAPSTIEVQTDMVIPVEVATDFGCGFDGRVFVDIVPTLYIPNAFSPNGDGVNDLWKIQGEGIEELEVQVFDRWGQRVFESNDIESGWNGSLNNGDHFCPNGIYTWFLEVEFLNGMREERTGSITLFR